MDVSDKQAVRYASQINLSGFDFSSQKALLNAHVLLIGVGGLGCAALQSLAASGVGHVTIVDDDTVSLSNLSRQFLFTEQDIGQPKVKVAAEYIKARFPDTGVSYINQKFSVCVDKLFFKTCDPQHYPTLDDKSVLQDVQVIVDCTDNKTARDAINQFAVTNKLMLISGAAIRMQGQLFTYVPVQNSACWHCVSHLFEQQEHSCSDAGILSPVVSMLGTLQALETLKALTDVAALKPNTLLMFDAITNQWQGFKVSKNSDCKVCQPPKL